MTIEEIQIALDALLLEMKHDGFRHPYTDFLMQGDRAPYIGLGWSRPATEWEPERTALRTFDGDTVADMIAAAREWLRQERGELAELRARQRNAELPAADLDLLRIKGMVA